MVMGRPTEYTPELADRICTLLATHPWSLNKILKHYDLPCRDTVYLWIHKYKDFSDKYLEARRSQAHILFDDLLDIPDTIPEYEDDKGNDRIDAGMLGRAKLEYEAKKWHTMKMQPKLYDQSKTIEALEGQNSEMKEELIKLRTQLEMQNKKDY